MKKLIALMAMAVSVITSDNVLAHGDKPQHGGVVSSANDLSFELVNSDGKTIVYVTDHGQPFNTAGATGKLTILNGDKKSEVPLDAGGNNTLATKGEAKITKGSKAVAAVTFADKTTVNVRFAMK
jgi:uncharacterized Zn-binding protein involved in type VI secretion